MFVSKSLYASNIVLLIINLTCSLSKLKILSQIRDYTGAIVIDIGHAMDALAGIVPKDRQYFGDWINYRIEGYDYSSVDILSQYMSKDKMDQFPLRDDVYLSICNKG